MYHVTELSSSSALYLHHSLNGWYTRSLAPLSRPMALRRRLTLVALREQCCPRGLAYAIDFISEQMRFLESLRNDVLERLMGHAG